MDALFATKNDLDLQREFASRGDEAAFRELVTRHLGLVLGTARRVVNDHGAAEEVAQTVFIQFARKSASLLGQRQLAGWLYRAALLEARQWVRTDRRRTAREAIAGELGTTMETPEPELKSLLALLDEGLEHLEVSDREALLLRFFEERSLRDVGAALGTSDDTAQKRVAKALDRLTHFFQRRGFATAGTAGTTAVLRAATLSSSPGLAGSISAAALAAAAGSAGTAGWLATALAKLGSLTKLQTLAACALVASGPAAYQWQALSRAQTDQNELHQQIATLERTVSGVARDLDLARRRARVAAEHSAATRASLARERQRRQALGGGEASLALYHWNEASEYIRVPRSLVGSLQLTTRGQWVPSWPRGQWDRGKPMSAEGKLDPVLAEALGLNDQEVAEVFQIFAEVSTAYEGLRTPHLREVRTIPPGFGINAEKEIGGQPWFGTLLEAFPIEGAALRDRARQRLFALIGPERCNVLWDQCLAVFREQLNDFGERSRFDFVVLEEGTSLRYSCRFSRNGQPDATGGRSMSGDVSPDTLPALLRAWVLEQRKNTSSPRATTTPGPP